MIITVQTKKELASFICFIKELYASDPTFAYPIFSALKKELYKEILVKKAYTGIICEHNGKIVGRLLYTISASKQKGCDIGYFSFFDCIDDKSVAAELFSYMERDLSGKVSYIEGTFSPYDPDTRRGILVKGFDYPHTIFTSKNFPYYGELLESVGYTKAYDTYSVTLPLSGKSAEVVEAVGERLARNKSLRVDNFSFEKIDREINDIHEILKEATFDLNYQEAPDIEMIRKVAKGMKAFINPELIKIAREAKTDRPIGFLLVLPDFNRILMKTKGKIRPLTFILGKRKLDGARGMMQYVIPEFQKVGALALLFREEYISLKKFGISYFEGGTIMEKNSSSWRPLVKLGGEISKVYRIYGKEI